MAQFDLPLDQLESYRYPDAEPADLDAFWSRTLAEARKHPLDVRLEPVVTPLRTVAVRDVEFAGFAGDRIRAWLVTPADADPDRPLPVVVEFIGYGGGRGLAHQHLLWASAGFAHLVVDTRGQGAGWSVGATPDPHGSTSSTPGFMTRGVDSPDDHYYRRVYTDAVRAVEAARTVAGLDPDRIVVTGGSQGGGISLAVSALVPDLAGVAARVPFLCAFRRSVALIDRDPYAEVRRYLAVHRNKRDVVFGTLDYFDNAHLASRSRCPAWISTALMDDVCPPSTVYAAYNAYAGPKRIQVWPFNGHEGGGADDDLLVLDFFRELLGT
ncbi:acetylxylan esterase [Micromonospora zhanjiangensis]|uniref:Acetylxylan esterase n=1 Tax=Micromonospora zhanjiangensis TaxID=1522057 RepID=A0ABV8KRK2_9ACTN